MKRATVVDNSKVDLSRPIARREIKNGVTTTEYVDGEIVVDFEKSFGWVNDSAWRIAFLSHPGRPGAMSMRDRRSLKRPARAKELRARLMYLKAQRRYVWLKAVELAGELSIEASADSVKGAF